MQRHDYLPQTVDQPSFNHQHCSNDHHWHQPWQSFDLAASNNMEILLVLLFWPKWKPEPSSGNWLINKLILPPLLQILPYTGVGEGSSTPSALPFFLPGPIKQQLTDKVGLPKAILRSTPSHSIYGILFPGREKSLLGFRTQMHKSKNLQMQQKILEGHTFKQYLFRLFLSISSDLSSGELKALDY